VRNTVVPGDSEPRVRDIKLAEVAEMPRPRQIRDIIKRNEAELQLYGPTPSRRAMVDIGGGEICRSGRQTLDRVVAGLQPSTG
jgi:hypothetical protein